MSVSWCLLKNWTSHMCSLPPKNSKYKILLKWPLWQTIVCLSGAVWSCSSLGGSFSTHNCYASSFLRQWCHGELLCSVGWGGMLRFQDNNWLRTRWTDREMFNDKERGNRETWDQTNFWLLIVHWNNCDQAGMKCEKCEVYLYILFYNCDSFGCMSYQFGTSIGWNMSY